MTPLEAFQNLKEMQNIPLKVEGKIPDWLAGEFVRNGPAIVKDKEGFIKSWFDGLAKLHAFTIDQGKVSYTCKFLQSDAYRKFRLSGEFDFLGFAEQPKTDQFSLVDFLFGVKNKEITNANVNIAKINNRWVALTEIPLPVEFDKSLNTLGPFDYSDSLPKNYSYESAHVLMDPDSKETWNFLIEIDLLDTAYQIYRIPHLSCARQLVASIPVESISYMHSFSLAGRYLVLVDYPLRAKNPKDLAHKFIQSFTWKKNEPTIVYVIDRETTKCWTFSTNAFFSFHHINGFEKNGKVFVDLIAYPTADIVHKVNYYPFIEDPENTLLRLEMDLSCNLMKVSQISRERVEFPRINDSKVGQEYRYFYAVRTQEKAEGNGIIKYDHYKGKHKYWYEEGSYANEPIFIPRPHSCDEDEGVVLSIINNLRTKASFLLILDAKSFKELARVKVPHLIPFGFHGQFFK